jgi:hypothetical protein
LPSVKDARRLASFIRHPSFVVGIGAEGCLWALYVGPRGAPGTGDARAARDVERTLAQAVKAAALTVPGPGPGVTIQHRWSDELVGFRPLVSAMAAA